MGSFMPTTNATLSDLLHYCQKHRVGGEELETAVSRITMTCPQGVETEKITAILGNKNVLQETMHPGSNEIMIMAKKQLQQVANLFGC